LSEVANFPIPRVFVAPVNWDGPIEISPRLWQQKLECLSCGVGCTTGLADLIEFRLVTDRGTDGRIRQTDRVTQIHSIYRARTASRGKNEELN